jgi:hypothetical protein
MSLRWIKCRLLLTIAAVLIVDVPIATADTPNSPLAMRARDLQADVAILERAYRELHPGLSRYLNPAQVDAAFATLRRNLSRDQTIQQAYLEFARFAAKIRCGHTYPNFFNQSRGVQQGVLEQTARLPFYFRWVDRKMVVTHDFTTQGILPAGTEVHRINGIRTDVILAKLMPLARADGANDDKRVDQLAVTGNSIYEPFDVYFPLVFGLPAGTVRLQVQSPGKRNARVVVAPTATYTERIAPIVAREEGRHGGDNALFEWQDLEDGTAYLRMPTWSVYDSRWDWRAWLNQRLDALTAREAPALIVDLRGNEGGAEVGDEILARLISSDLLVDDLKRLVRYRAVPKDLEPYLETWDPSFRDWGTAAAELEQPWPTAPNVHYLGLNRDDNAARPSGVLHPAARHFSGKVFVLVDASNSSATFQFANIVQRHRLGILVGQPTGGNRRGINGGAFFFLRLPHSGIELDLPLIGYFPPVQEADAGLLPDLVVRRSPADVALHTDVELAAIRRLLAAPL